VLLLSSVAGTGRAQSTAQDPLSLEAAWQFALSNSADAREAESLRRAGLRDEDDAATGMLPTASVFGGYNANNYENAGSGWVGNLRLQRPGGDLGQQLLRFKDRAVLARLGALRSRAVLDQLRFRILRGYCRYHFVTERLAVQQKAVESFGGLWDTLDPQAGGAAVDATLLGDLVEDLERIEATHEESEAELDTVLRGLRDAIGAPAGHALRPVGDLAALVARLSELPGGAVAFAANPGLELAEETARLAEQDAKLATLRKWPQPELDLDLSLGRDELRYWFQPSVESRSRWQVVGGLRWSFLNWGRASRDVQAAVDRRDVFARRAGQMRSSLEGQWQELQDKAALLQKRGARLEQWVERLEIVLAAHGAGEPGRLESIKDFVRLNRRVVELKVQALETRSEILLLSLEARRLLGGLEQELPQKP
jgi:outer membrane protein TolC